MAQKLRGKVAVVTGGGSGGIGRGVSLALAAEGASVVINDIARDTNGKSIADKVVEEIKEAGGTAVANYDSVATMQGGENIVKTAITNFNRVDILVNCAGNNLSAPINEITEEQWDSVIDVHVKGHFACIRAVVPHMMQQKSGRIINFSSRAAFAGGAPLPGKNAPLPPPGTRGPAGGAVYSTAKAAILGFTLSLSGGLKPYGITVNAIVPSADTKLFPGKTRPKDSMPSSLCLEPDHVAPIVAYLATDEADGITGRFIYASGGDLCIFARPLQLPGDTHMFIRKIGKWTIDELSQVVPPLLGLS